MTPDTHTSGMEISEATTVDSKLKIWRQNGSALVELTGRIIFDNLIMTQRALEELAAAGLSKVFLKMDRLNYLDSSALGMLLSLNTNARSSGTDIVMLSPPPNIRAMFICTHLDSIFHIVAEEEAEKIASEFESETVRDRASE